eukprot:EC687011.1.p1 GENE.EC687011.1~~EC687011.1.p1  ORF type:complete len:128 (+),score=43.18 EC687011.1:207-590(+)
MGSTSWIAVVVIDLVLLALILCRVNTLRSREYPLRYIVLRALQWTAGVLIITGGWVLAAGAGWVNNAFRLSLGLPLFCGGAWMLAFSGFYAKRYPTDMRRLRELPHTAAFASSSLSSALSSTTVRHR